MRGRLETSHLDQSFGCYNDNGAVTLQCPNEKAEGPWWLSQKILKAERNGSSNEDLEFCFVLFGFRVLRGPETLKVHLVELCEWQMRSLAYWCSHCVLRCPGILAPSSILTSAALRKKPSLAGDLREGKDSHFYSSVGYRHPSCHPTWFIKGRWCRDRGGWRLRGLWGNAMVTCVQQTERGSQKN